MNDRFFSDVSFYCNIKQKKNKRKKKKNKKKQMILNYSMLSLLSTVTFVTQIIKTLEIHFTCFGLILFRWHNCIPLEI